MKIQSGGSPAAVVGGHDMGPAGQGKDLITADRNRISRPEMDKGEGQLAVLEHQLVALASRIRPSARTVREYGTLEVLRHIQPHGETQGVRAGDCSDPGETNVIFPGQAQGPPRDAFLQNWILGAAPGTLGMRGIGGLAALERLEGKVAFEVRPARGQSTLGIGGPGVKALAAFSPNLL